MTKQIKMILNTIITLSLMAFSTHLLAADDPNIKGDLRSNINTSMNQFIENQTINGSMFLFDDIKGGLMKLKLVELHEGIVKKGDFFVSCADFVDQNDKVVDVDFLVRQNEERFITTQAIIHSVDGTKRKYHLEKL